MPKIRKADEISAKWSRVTPQRDQEYKSGIENPLDDWASQTLSASSRRDDGLKKAIADGRIDRGIKRAGTDKWQTKTLAKGPSRWQEGVTISQADYEAGFAPYRDVIEKTDLPPRYPKGDPRNWERSKTLGLALHDRKVKG